MMKLKIDGRRPLINALRAVAAAGMLEGRPGPAKPAARKRTSKAAARRRKRNRTARASRRRNR